MDSFLRGLDESRVVVDLGCGRGSFYYEECRGQLIGIDIAIPEADLARKDERIRYVQADSSAIPLGTSSVDAVICHNTLEHFPDYKRTLTEIGRILGPGGLLWAAVPNGYGFDDALYRFLFSGGGHLNRFTREGLIEDVRELSGLELVQSSDLFSGFIYLKKPTAAEVRHFPRTARFLIDVPDGFSAAGAVAINTATRVIDKITGSRYSQYGWAFLFARGKHDPIEPLPSHFNVCRQCGSGSPASTLKRQSTPSLFGLRIYSCPFCGKKNVFVPPPVLLS